MATSSSVVPPSSNLGSPSESRMSQGPVKRQSRHARRRAVKKGMLADSLPFPVPTRFRIDIKLPHTTEIPKLLPVHSHIGIPNPDYSGIEGTPRYAAFRLLQCINLGQQARLRALVSPLLSTEPPHQSQSDQCQQSGFHRWWNGPPSRVNQRDPVSDEEMARKQAIKFLLRAYDSILGGSPCKLLSALDPTVAKAMGVAHRQVHRHQGLVAGEVKPATQIGECHYKEIRESKKWKPSEKENEEFVESTHASSARLGGMGTLLRVVSDEMEGGRAWDIGVNGQRDRYNIITCLGQSFILHLPELGYSMPVRPGDVIGLLGYKYSHQLVMKGGTDGNEHAKASIVFVAWSDEDTKQSMEKSCEFAAR